LFRPFAAGALAVAALHFPHSALAHHPGSAGNSGGAGPIVTIPATTLEQGHVAAFLIHEYTRLNELSDAVLIDAAGRHQHVHSIGTIQSTALGAAFGVTNDVTVSVRLPFVLRSDIREGTHTHVHGGAAVNTVTARGDASGVGDATVLGQWRFLNNAATATEAALLFGVKLPTGATSVRDRAGELFEAEFQPGSGSTDALIGAAFTQRFGPWSFDANVLYIAVHKGTQDTDLGDRFNYNAAVSYRLFGPVGRTASISGVPANATYTHSGHTHRHSDGKMHKHAPEAPPAPQWTLDAVLELNGERHARQRIEGLKDPNSGGHTVYLSPGLRASYANFSGFVSLGVPVFNDVNGLQDKPDYRLVSGLAFGF
jgi:hypothetical protein